MTGYLKNYTKELEQMLGERHTHDEWKTLLKHHRERISYFQHERLVHLLVTLTFGIALLLSTLATMANPSFVLFGIDALLFILFVPYLFHYRSLENGVQKLYKLTDEIESHLSEKE